MIKWIWTAALLSTGTLVFAATNNPLSIQKIFTDGQQFVFERVAGDPPRHGIQIKDPVSKAILYEVKVTKCGPTKCLGTITKNLSGLPISMEESYLHSYNEKVESIATTKTAGKKKKQKKKKDPGNARAYVGYGSPLGPGFSLGYFNRFSGDLNWGVRYANVSSEASSVAVKAHLVTFALIYPFIEFSEDFKLNGIGEVGFMKSTLDFSGVNSLGPEIDVSTYIAALGGEAAYQFSETFGTGLRFGFSKNGQKADYARSNGTYHNPFSKLLAYMELGLYWGF